MTKRTLIATIAVIATAALALSLVPLLAAPAGAAAREPVSDQAVSVRLAGASVDSGASVETSATALRYAALGDSFAAGNGASAPLSGGEDEVCRRTSNGYANVLADLVAADTGGDVDIATVACSGATTTSTRTGSDTAPGLDGQPREITGPDQLAALGPDTDVVTITAGANDTDFTAVLQACLLDPAGCEAAVAAGTSFYDGQDLVDLLLAVDAAVAGEDRTAPARVLVTGYAQPFDVEGVAQRQCGPFTFVPGTPAAAEAVNAGTQQLNTLVEAATAQAASQTSSTQVTFVDVDPAFEGNRICSTDPWLNPPSLFVPFERWLHPDDDGHRAYAGELREALGDLGGGTELPVLAADRDPDLSPILECVVDNGDGSLTARFGYENRETAEPAEFQVPVGDLNRLSGPVTATDGPVTDFVQPGVVPGRPGRTPFGEGAFTATFDAGERVVWSLHGRTATASSGSTACSA